MNLRKKVKKAIYDPGLAIQTLKKKCVNRVPRAPRKIYGWKKKRQYTIPIPNQDWDNLVILDGCRYDAFRKNCLIRGELEYRWSHATSSVSFMNKNFSKIDGAHNDTIFITAAKFHPLNTNSFFIFKDNDDEFDPDLGTIPPRPVVEEAKKLADRYQNKRIILWLMQPHNPFINENGLVIDEAGGWNSPPQGYNGEYDGSKPKVWTLIKQGEIDQEEAWDAYIESLQYAVSLISEFSQYTTGKTILTADHGQAFGDRPYPLFTREYGAGEPGPETMKVPWFTLPFDERKEISRE